MNARLYSFAAGGTGRWRVVSSHAVRGDGLPRTNRLDVLSETTNPSILAGSAWVLRGLTSNERYVTRSEKDDLVRLQPPLGRVEATCAAFIPLRKSASWWGLAQDERRAIFENTSHHIMTGLRYLPAIARRLHHCRDLGAEEPFDFLTLFEYAPSDEALFDELVATLRATEEWTYVEREVDLRLVREP